MHTGIENLKVLLITPPFTQLNTPYPATAYLKGYLDTLKVDAAQVDLGIEVVLQLFTKTGLQALFGEIESVFSQDLSLDQQKKISQQEIYINTIEAVIGFLQGRDDMLSHRIVARDFLPEGKRFQEIEDKLLAFGTMGIRDKARYLATMYLEDLSDLIKETVDPHFGFSRYAESLGLNALDFELLSHELEDEPTFVDDILLQLLDYELEHFDADLVCLTVPFPGNLYSALRCGKHIKDNYEGVAVAMGGGYANTELRKLKDRRVFEMLDFITLDDGEMPLRNLLEYLAGNRTLEDLKRCFTVEDEVVVYSNGSKDTDVTQGALAAPSYEGLNPVNYLSAIDLVNPMQRLWNDGWWNKLTMAHGCYWGKCTFCDISLSYIRDYEQNSARDLCNRVEYLIKQTGKSSFHFVDEAAPPALMKKFAQEILHRGLVISWWANIRFEKSFNAELCSLLKKSGCVAVSGGLEVASDRLLKLINKGVTVQQVAQVTSAFSKTGIMVHAYLMYGFPSQTSQETIDSLEMVRQLFENKFVQSAYWHKFTMTAHSPVGMNPGKFAVSALDDYEGSFANNDIPHVDKSGADHECFGEGLRASLYNYMHGIGFDIPLNYWFDFEVPATTVDKKYIKLCVS